MISDELGIRTGWTTGATLTFSEHHQRPSPILCLTSFCLIACEYFCASENLKETEVRSKEVPTWKETIIWFSQVFHCVYTLILAQRNCVLLPHHSLVHRCPSSTSFPVAAPHFANQLSLNLKPDEVLWHQEGRKKMKKHSICISWSCFYVNTIVNSSSFFHLEQEIRCSNENKMTQANNEQHTIWIIKTTFQCGFTLSTDTYAFFCFWS